MTTISHLPQAWWYKEKEKTVPSPNARPVTLVSVAPATGRLLSLSWVVEGRQETFALESHVAAVLAGEIARALGHSALYNAGLERAAQVVSSATTEDISADPRDDLERLALEIRECKIGKGRR